MQVSIYFYVSKRKAEGQRWTFSPFHFLPLYNNSSGVRCKSPSHFARWPLKLYKTTFCLVLFLTNSQPSKGFSIWNYLPISLWAWHRTLDITEGSGQYSVAQSQFLWGPGHSFWPIITSHHGSRLGPQVMGAQCTSSSVSENCTKI